MGLDELSWRKIIGISVVIVVIALSLALYTLSRPSESQVRPPAQQIDLHEAVVSENAVEGIVVDVDEDRALVRYDLSPNQSVEEMEYYTLTAAARTTNSPKIIVETYKNGTKQRITEVEREYMMEYLNGTMTIEGLEKHISREEPS